MKNPNEMTISEIKGLLWENSAAQSYCAALIAESFAEQERIKRYVARKISEHIEQDHRDAAPRPKKYVEPAPDFVLPAE